MKEFICYNAGCGIWEVEPFDSTIDWHNEEFRGTKNECLAEVSKRSNGPTAHYPNAEYESIFDY